MKPTKVEGIISIAKFMNAECMMLQSAHYPDKYPHTMTEGHQGYKPLKYDTEWGELMPVLLKIGNVLKNDDRSFLHLIIWSEYIWNTHPIKLNIEKTFDAVVEFTQWYNATHL